MKNPFWQRKMKHQFSCLDANKNGILSSDDFEILANRWIECGKLNQEQGKKVRTYVLGFWPAIGNGKEAVKEDEFLIGLSSVLGGEIAFLVLVFKLHCYFRRAKGQSNFRCIF